MNAMICSCKEVIDWWRVDLRRRMQRMKGSSGGCVAGLGN